MQLTVDFPRIPATETMGRTGSPVSEPRPFQGIPVIVDRFATLSLPFNRFGSVVGRVKREPCVAQHFHQRAIRSRTV